MSTAAPQERPLKSDLHSIRSITGHDACLPWPSQLEKLLGIQWKQEYPFMKKSSTFLACHLGAERPLLCHQPLPEPSLADHYTISCLFCNRSAVSSLYTMMELQSTMDTEYCVIQYHTT